MKKTNGRKEYFAEFKKIIFEISARHGEAETLKAFLCILVNFFTDGNYEKQRDEQVKPLLKSKELLNKAFYVFLESYKDAMECQAVQWIDPLGELYEDLASNSRRSGLGQFFTPPEVCDMMALMTVKPDSTGTVGEPASGSGRNILAAHAVAPKMDFYAVEKDYILFLMTAVNMFLNGCLGRVFHGDSLSMEMYEGLAIVRTKYPYAQVFPLIMQPFTPTAREVSRELEQLTQHSQPTEQPTAAQAPPVPPVPPAPEEPPKPAKPEKPQQLFLF